MASRQVGYFRVAAAELPAAAAVTAVTAAAAGWRCEAWDTTLTPDVSRDVTCCLLSELHFIFKIFSFLPSRNKYFSLKMKKIFCVYYTADILKLY